MTKYNQSTFKYLDTFEDNKLKLYANKIGINKNKINKSSRPKLYKLIYKKYNKSALKIQNFIKKNKIYNNDYTLLGDKIKDIDNNLLYIINNYAFDIKEIYENLKFTKENPYTKEIISEYHIQKINKKINKLEKSNVNIKIESEIPKQSLVTSKTANLFSKLSFLHAYPNVTIFIKYTNEEYLLYFKQIIKYKLISDNLNEKRIQKLEKLYNSCKNNKDIEIKFRCIGINILENLININDNHNYTRGLIITENIVSNIKYKYELPLTNNYSYYNDLYDNIINNTVPTNIVNWSPSNEITWDFTFLNETTNI